MKSNTELEAELVEVRQAIRDLVALESRFKPPSFERSPMPALQRILASEELYEPHIKRLQQEAERDD